QLTQKRRRLPRERGAPRIAPLQVDHRRQHVQTEATAMTAFQLPLYVNKDTQGLPISRLAQRQQVKEIGETAIALAQDAQGLRRDFSKNLHRRALQVRLKNVGNAQRGAGALARQEQSQQIVEVEDVPPPLSLLEYGEQAIFPLTDVGHAGDQP